MPFNPLPNGKLFSLWKYLLPSPCSKQMADLKYKFTVKTFIKAESIFLIPTVPLNLTECLPHSSCNNLSVEGRKEGKKTVSSFHTYHQHQEYYRDRSILDLRKEDRKPTLTINTRSTAGIDIFLDAREDRKDYIKFN